FQAEDGIRDLIVTGVQTCALPISRDEMQRLLAEVWRETRKTVIYVTHNVAEAVYLADRVIVMTPHPGAVKATIPITLPRPRDPRSEERRVGKEWRSRGARDAQQRK